MNTHCISLDSLLSDHYCAPEAEEPLLLLADAEIILGQDATTHKLFVVDGQETLKQVVQNHPQEAPNVVVVELHQDSDELRQLNWLIKVVKCR